MIAFLIYGMKIKPVVAVPCGIIIDIAIAYKLAEIIKGMT